MCWTSRPSALHPANIVGLTGVMRDLVADGNSVCWSITDAQILAEGRLAGGNGPGAGAAGGHVIAQGTVAQLAADPDSRIGPFLHETGAVGSRARARKEALFDLGRLPPFHRDHPYRASFGSGVPQGAVERRHRRVRLSKTTLILESLIPALEAAIHGCKLPGHVRAVEAPSISQVKLIDATPIGINVRSTVATYANVHDELRKIFARTDDARRLGYKAGDFPTTRANSAAPPATATGVISLDVQFLPDVEIPCPACRGSRYGRDAERVRCANSAGERFTLPELMAMDVHTALKACREMKLVSQRLQVLEDLGLGYLTLGEETPSLSGGEAQRLKLASEMGRAQDDSVFVFDEPTSGLHPLDVRTLLGVFQTLIDHGATVVVHRARTSTSFAARTTSWTWGRAAVRRAAGSSRPARRRTYATPRRALPGGFCERRTAQKVLVTGLDRRFSGGL